jgi:GT2 family glycosyltransferase
MHRFPMSSSPDLVGIGIATRDRWPELEITLTRLRERGFDRLETVVIDDGSRVPMPADFATRFPWVRFVHSPTHRGYIAQRNELARLVAAPMVFSLDDDSHIESGDPIAAAKWLAAAPEVIALAFSIVPGDAPPVPETAASPAPVRFFIGCAHLMKREPFLQLGGYRVELGSYCEEFEFSLRAWKSGFTVFTYPGLVVRHLVSANGRDKARLNRFLTRNDLWIAAWHYPLLSLVLSVLNCLPRQFFYSAHRKHWRAVAAGFLAAFLHFPKVRHRRSPQSLRQFRAWRKRPSPSPANADPTGGAPIEMNR